MSFARSALCALLIAASAAPAWAAADEDIASSSAATRPARAAAAANAFLATLDDAQRKLVLFPFNDAAQRSRWSNLPDPVAPRSGVRWGDLAVRQRVALAVLLATVLSPSGMRMVRQQMDADDLLRDAPSGQPPVGNFGSAYYYVSFVGTPSASKPWMLQFGGHHLAINATMIGPRITLSPTLTGGEPRTYTKDGKPVSIGEKEIAAAAALFDSLSPDQRAKAVIATTPIDLVRGPGQDGRGLPPEGLAGKTMTDDQKELLLALIEARLGMLDADAAQSAKIGADIDKTYFAWFGPDMPLGEAYFRVTGPSVLIEYAPHGGGAADIVYRDPTNEYGAAWTSLK